MIAPADLLERAPLLAAAALAVLGAVRLAGEPELARGLQGLGLMILGLAAAFAVGPAGEAAVLPLLAFGLAAFCCAGLVLLRAPPTDAESGEAP